MKNILFWESIETDKTRDELKATNTPHLVPFLQEDGSNFPCVIVVPGGGYGGMSLQESEPVAGWLNGLGISAFVLNYTVAPTKHPKPYHDVRRAIQWVRANAAEYNLDPARIGVLGFSAGGHLAGSAAVMWEDVSLAVGDALDSVSARPDLAVLCYPVITADKTVCHEGSIANLTGRENASAEERDAVSLERRVTKNTPPTFIWHTADDALVSVENAYLMAQALGRSNVEYEFHVFPEGEHGLGLCSVDFRRNAYVSQWKNLCEQWLYRQGF
jgi:acetyl esterase/lipase